MEAIERRVRINKGRSQSSTLKYLLQFFTSKAVRSSKVVCSSRRARPQVDKAYLKASFLGFRAFQNYPAYSPTLRAKLRALNPVWRIQCLVSNSLACPAKGRRG